MTGFRNTIAEDVIGAVGVVVVVVLALVRGKSGWAAGEEAAWVVLGVLAYHWWRAVIGVWKEIASHPPTRLVESLLYGSDRRKERLFIPEEPPANFRVKLAVIGVVFTALSVVGGWGIHAFAAGRATPSPPIALNPTEVYMECHMMPLPIHVPPGSTAHVKVFNKKEYGNTKSSVYDVRNDGDKELLWPEEKLIKQVKFNPGVFGYSCELSNHAQVNLIDVAVRLSISYDNEKTPLDYFVVASPLDGGKAFPFYLVNECPVSVSVIAQGDVGVQVLGEDGRRTVPLHFPNRSPIQQIMILMPSKVRWTGDPCE